MKTLIISILLIAFSSVMSAKSITVKYSQVESFETVNNSKFFIHLKNGKTFELYASYQIKAIAAVLYSKGIAKDVKVKLL